MQPSRRWTRVWFRRSMVGTAQESGASASANIDIVEPARITTTTTATTMMTITTMMTTTTVAILMPLARRSSPFLSLMMTIIMDAEATSSDVATKAVTRAIGNANLTYGKAVSDGRLFSMPQRHA